MLSRAFIVFAIALASSVPFSVHAEPYECLVFGRTQNGTPTATNKCNRKIWLAFCSTKGDARCKQRPTTVTPTRRYYDYGLDSIRPNATMWLIGVPRDAQYAISACFDPDKPYITKWNGIASYTSWCFPGGAPQGTQDAQRPAAASSSSGNHCGLAGVAPDGSCVGYDPEAGDVEKAIRRRGM